MGQSAFIAPNHTPAVPPMAKAGKTRKPHPLFLQVDVPLLLAVCTLLVIGLIMVYSASWNYPNTPNTYTILLRQARWVLLGVILAIILSRIDYHTYGRYVVWMMAVTIALLIAVLGVGETHFNATRTLFKGSVQPSELAKLATVVYLSFWLFSKREQISDFFRGLFPMAVILGIISGLIFLEPDLSAAFTIFVLGGLLFFAAGGELRQIVLVALVVVLMASLLITLSDTGKTRLTQYISGLQSPIQASYHVRRSIEAVVRGQLFGVGLGNSSTKYTGLPVPWTDSIFAVIAEETGIVGASAIVILYLVFLWRGIHIAQRAPDLLGSLLATGITSWITLEAMINMGVLVNVFPFAGNALPLISAGGSSMVTTMVGIGILMSVARSTVPAPINNDTERSTPSAVINLRWRDRRRRLPRNGRSERPR